MLGIRFLVNISAENLLHGSVVSKQVLLYLFLIDMSSYVLCSIRSLKYHRSL